MDGGEPWRRRDGGVDLAIRLTPRAAIDRVDGVGSDAAGRTHLKVHVRAAPENGAANAAACSTIAAWIGVPKSAVMVLNGATRREKRLRIDGDPDRLVAALRMLAADGKSG